ncbi:phosphatidylinositol-specific phospholipase C [Microdochium bolleyi]|uniref:Phosphoinositide phospholipase C n=1 Tax=Microdochium bolleyi TaxID=196109 RepID=A0A136J7U4_9PEZI|nr:phosphatidylinositol-specific phospholipase C [Microdochium bolleyi]
MASTSYSPRARSGSQTSIGTPIMAAQNPLLRRARTHQYPTSQPAIQPTSAPSSYPASYTAPALFPHESPLLSPETSGFAMSSSANASPDYLRGRDIEQFPVPPPFALGEALLSRKPSANSLTHNGAGAPPNAMATVMGDRNDAGGKGLMRRLSNRAHRLARPRRTSSVAPRSRDASVGPGILRRRSDSTNTAPPMDNAFFTDSDEELADDLLDLNSVPSVFGGESMLRDLSSGSTAMSQAGSSPLHEEAPPAPIVPLALIKGTDLNKVSKKSKLNGRLKRINMILESETGKLIWTARNKQKCLYIDDIKEIRTRSDIRQARIDHGVPEADEGRFFSIFYSSSEKSRSKVMHLVADDEETFSHWVTALDSVSKHREVQMASLMAFNDGAVFNFWQNEMLKHFEGRNHTADEEVMDFSAVQRVCRNLHIHITLKDLRAKFSIADSNQTGKLNYAQFQVFVSEMKRRGDIRRIYQSITSDPDRGMTWPEFANFLEEEQDEDVAANPIGWESKFKQYARRYRVRTTGVITPEKVPLTLTEQGFSAYLTSKDNHRLHPAPASYSFDRPINEYFIASSHNTYLVGRQVADVSSLEGYITTLVRGCRSVEVDCWDGSDGQPSVKHGWALTNPISFREVMFTINKYAFVASQFPLWISLEVHCNKEQQEIMAETIKEIFGPRLVTAPLDPSSDKLPSPSELIGRILVKVKQTAEKYGGPGGSEPTGRRRGNSLTSPFAKAVPLDNSAIPTQKLGTMTKRVDTIDEGKVHDMASSSTSEGESDDERQRQKQKTSKIVKSLGELGVYCSGVKFQGFESDNCKKANHILSFMEGTFRKHTKAGETKAALQRHNMRFMMRVYPQFNRIHSNNFNPLMYWRKGVQMAALNWQTFDRGMQLNQAMFEGGTDVSGYVLKPSPMREFRIFHNPLPADAVGKLERANMTFTISVISAQQLMRPASLPQNRGMDPYVEVEIFHANDKRDKHDSMAGIPILTDTPLIFRTPVVAGNGFNPTFDKEFPFNITTKYPELVFIKWSVKLSSDGETAQDRNITIGTYTAKLSSLKRGFRTLPLLDGNGDQFLFSTLFCRIKVDPATSVYVNREAQPEPVGKFKYIGRTILNRGSSANKGSSDKATFDKISFEKQTIERSAYEGT